jgi:NADP-dependent aldehyde dehydrogenase
MINTANRIGYQSVAQGMPTLQSVNPVSREVLPGHFHAATREVVNAAMEKAVSAFHAYRSVGAAGKAAFLRAIAAEIEALGPPLIERAMEESGLPEARLLGERGRTCGQLRLFADFLEEGSWVNAIIETALPERQPLPRPDIRNVLQPIGPVAVFTASNFPLAFSTAGGDTASALAAGCPVVVKAHPSHLGTNALVAEAILRAARRCDMPDGVFSSLNDAGTEVALHLVQHPALRAVAFTGSHQGGMALFRAALDRTAPIPVFAEMGSINPMFLLPLAVQANGEGLANAIAASVTLGAGQFCTNPGLIVIMEDAAGVAFVRTLAAAMAQVAPATMLNKGVFENYEQRKEAQFSIPGVSAAYPSAHRIGDDWKGRPALATVSAEAFLAAPALQEEVFGPSTLVVWCKDRAVMQSVAASLHGQLTATIMGENTELGDWKALAEVLQEKVGRLLFNGVPTGVEVGHAMQHGGPFPATTDARFTSVGTQAVRRFVRPVAYQNCPDFLLPDALKDGNPSGIFRFFNGKWGKE